MIFIKNPYPKKQVKKQNPSKKRWFFRPRARSERGQEVLAGHRVVYPWPEKLGLQLVEKSPSNAEFKFMFRTSRANYPL